jgi:PIN domain nuclease of toxin-antitoxin system
MNYLLDTSTFIWMASEPQQLSSTATAICSNRANTLFLSIGSIWELQIKLQIGKLTLPLPLEQMIENQQQVNQLQLLPIMIKHVLGLDKLPPIHKDPFDRMLIAQTLVEGLSIVSRDSEIVKYPVSVVW